MIVGFGANGATKPNHCEKIELSANQQQLASWTFVVDDHIFLHF